MIREVLTVLDCVVWAGRSERVVKRIAALVRLRPRFPTIGGLSERLGLPPPRDPDRPWNVIVRTRLTDDLPFDRTEVVIP